MNHHSSYIITPGTIRRWRVWVGWKLSSLTLMVSFCLHIWTYAALNGGAPSHTMSPVQLPKSRLKVNIFRW